MVRTEPHITSSCHPQSNALCERQNRIVKDSLVQVLDENSCDWLCIVKGNLFTQSDSKYTSMKYSPFFLLYNREATLPIDINFELMEVEAKHSDGPFSKEIAWPAIIAYSTAS